jgi:glycosyltransferase involved in cell wall biosynthesis
MPSFVEGFGLPIIEALSLGCPVIASDLPVFREIGGQIPTFVDPLDREGWERWIRAFAGDDPERSRQTGCMQNYQSPQWAEHFAIVDAWLARL